MATINKLAILGIRSFGQENTEVLEFIPPLTLIVGHNGSGKTTIIECLKYATTGELPPGAKTGGAFIHDPRMAARKDVVAQVRLLFHNTNGVRMVCTRSMQLSIARNGTRKQTTLDGQLLLETATGERTAISSRCAELDVQMPLSLGVSKAVLENVIFCHQEDSFWPLSEPGPLKKKFDDIFENARYTRALTELKELKKGQDREVKSDQQTLEFMKADKERADKITKESTFLLEEIQKKQERIDSLQFRINQNQTETQTLFSTTQAFQATIATLRTLREKLAHTRQSRDALAGQMQEYTESDEELQAMQGSFGTRNDEAVEKVREAGQRRERLGKELGAVRGDLGRKTVEMGGLEEAKRAHERNLRRRGEVVREVAVRHGFKVESQDGEEDIEGVKRLLYQSLKEEKGKLDKIKREAAIQEKGLTESLHSITLRQQTQTAQKNSSKNHLQTLTSKLVDLQSHLDSLTTSESDISSLKTTLAETQEALERAETEFDAAGYDARAAALEGQITAVEGDLRTIQTELTSASAQSDARAKLDVLRSDITKKEAQREQLISSHGAKFGILTGQHLDPETDDSILNKLIRRKNDDVEESARTESAAQSDLTTFEAKIASARDQLKERRRERNEAQKAVMDVSEVGIEGFPALMAELEESMVDVRGQLENLRYAGTFFEKACKDAQDRGVCSLCQRELADDDIDDFMHRMNKNIDNIPQRRKSLEKDLEENESNLAVAKKHSPAYDTYTRLTSTEIPKLESEIETLTAQLTVSKATLEKHTAAHDALKTDLRGLENLRRPVGEIARLSKEIEESRREVSRAEAALGEGGRGMSGEEIRERMGRLNEERGRLGREIRVVAAEKEKARSRIQGLREGISGVRVRIGEGESKVVARRGVVRDIEDVKGQMEKARQDIETATKRIEALDPELVQIQDKLQQLRDHLTTDEDKTSSKILKLQDSIHQFEAIETEIARYLAADSPRLLAAVQQTVHDHQTRIAELEGELVQLGKTVAEAEGNIANMKALERNVADNLRWREMGKEIEKMRTEIKELERQGAEVEVERYQEQAEKLRKAHNKWTAEQATMAGEIKQMDVQLQKYNDQLRTEFKDSHEKYRRQHIKVKTTSAATDDLAKYAKALDSAIMKFHSMKMEEINRIIGELWRSTYVGTDVDTILIRSEKEDQKANRVYNYRVTMIKDSVELDMRGRCSAGQKVLACIIIRLALAESFGDKFGVLALDEPTTNLDRENIESLAKSLASLVRHRRAQSNFQLIVITHDEEFLRFMGCSDFVENYYRVGRDAS